MDNGLSPATLERSEAEALFDFEAAAPGPVRAALGMDAARAGGGVVLAMRGDPSGFWNKALGFTGPVTAGLVDEVCAFYRDRRAPMAVLQFAPDVLPDDWARISAEAGLTEGGAWVKLACPADVAARRLDEPDRPVSGLRVAPVTAGDAATWASAMLRTFGMPEEGLAEMVAGTVGRDGWHPYAAWDGDELVGTGTMHVHQDTAQFFAGATLPHARGRGAQSALLAARVRAALEAGCRVLVAETGAEEPGGHNSSLHNLRRAGFEVRYERRNWIWRPDGESG